MNQIATSIYVYYTEEHDPRNGLPKDLSDLVTAGIMREVPRCQCDDGKERDFVYISGYHHIPEGYVFLASPPEMNATTIMVYFGGDVRPKLLPNDEALVEIARSRAFLKVLNGGELDTPTKTPELNSTSQPKHP